MPSHSPDLLGEITLSGGPLISHVISLHEAFHASQNGTKEVREMQGTAVTLTNSGVQGNRHLVPGKGGPNA